MSDNSAQNSLLNRREKHLLNRTALSSKYPSQNKALAEVMVMGPKWEESKHQFKFTYRVNFSRIVLI